MFGKVKQLMEWFTCTLTLTTVNDRINKARIQNPLALKYYKQQTIIKIIKVRWLPEDLLVNSSLSHENIQHAVVYPPNAI